MHVGVCVGYGVCIRLRVTEWCISVCVYASMHACAYMCVHASGHVTFGDDHCKVDSHRDNVSTDKFYETGWLQCMYLLADLSHLKRLTLYLSMLIHTHGLVCTALCGIISLDP